MVRLSAEQGGDGRIADNGRNLLLRPPSSSLVLSRYVYLSRSRESSGTAGWHTARTSGDTTTPRLTDAFRQGKDIQSRRCQEEGEVVGLAWKNYLDGEVGRMDALWLVTFHVPVIEVAEYSTAI